MPFKSQAQRRKFAQMVAEGKMSQATFDKWEKETGDTKLPDKVPGKVGATRQPRRVRRIIKTK